MKLWMLLDVHPVLVGLQQIGEDSGYAKWTYIVPFTSHR